MDLSSKFLKYKRQARVVQSPEEALEHTQPKPSSETFHESQGDTSCKKDFKSPGGGVKPQTCDRIVPSPTRSRARSSAWEFTRSNLPTRNLKNSNVWEHGVSSTNTEHRAAASKITQPLMKTRQTNPDDDPELESLIKQPESRPISQEQLVAEVKGIYAGLVMVESKCIDIDNSQSAQNDSSPKLNNEQWQALIALHRTLLHENHDFFLASQHPSASPALRRLASKYAMPARMWRHGIHSFLELLRHRLPQSLEHMLTFIYLAYSMMALLYETVPAFEDTWIECLGDLGRYRMAIEDDDIRDRETWTGVSRHWYSKASDKAPTAGRLYHHLAILARPNVVQQLSYYAKSLCVAVPFLSARESILTLFDPILIENKVRLLPVDTGFSEGYAAFARNCDRFRRIMFFQVPQMVSEAYESHHTYVAARGLTLPQHFLRPSKETPTLYEVHHRRKIYNDVRVDGVGNTSRDSTISKPAASSTSSAWLLPNLSTDQGSWICPKKSIYRLLNSLVPVFRTFSGLMILSSVSGVTAAPLQTALPSGDSISSIPQKVISLAFQAICLAIAVCFNFSRYTNEQKRQMNAIAMAFANYVTVMLASNTSTPLETLIG